MIEDVMQSSLPKFIYSVRVSDMSQGSNPFRITSIRSLPDADMSDTVKDLPKEEQDRLKGKHVVRYLTLKLLAGIQNVAESGDLVCIQS